MKMNIKNVFKYIIIVVTYIVLNIFKCINSLKTTVLYLSIPLYNFSSKTLFIHQLLLSKYNHIC